MQADNFQNNKKVSIKSDFSADGRVISLLNFLDKYLPIFPEKYIKNIEDDEWDINEALFSFFDIYSRNYAFQFIPEYRYKNKSRPDFGIKEVNFDETGIYAYDQNAEHFFDIECKRLYHKTKSIQYVVYEKIGGIQRFKENKHGVDLPYSAMIGYVEIEDFDYWHKRINSWIKDETEHLKMIEVQKIAKLKSKHIRYKEKTKIELIHFWLNLN